MPEILNAFTAAQSRTDESGTHVIGAFARHVFSPDLPASGSLAVVIEMSFEHDECGQSYDCEIGIVGPDGEEVAGARNTLEPMIEMVADHYVRVPAILNVQFDNLQLWSYGDYDIDIRVDGESLRTLEFRLTREPEAIAS